MRRWARVRSFAAGALLIAAATSASAATWTLHDRYRGDRAPPGVPASGPPPVSRTRPLPPPAPTHPRSSIGIPSGPNLLPAVRARIARGDPRAPAAEVDRWILRLATEPGLRAWLEDGLGRMSRYEPLVREALRRDGEPEELLYLGLVESQFRAGAESRAGAAGLWQFMTGTGRLYDLEVSEYVDERRDPVRSTRAAVRHLGYLHREFASWHLALAAYNAGDGRVRGLLRGYARGRRGDETLYWRIRPRLPRETRSYVPLYLAAAEIARDPAAFGLRPRPRPALAFAERWTAGGVRLADVARELGVAPDAVLELNPHLVRGMTPPGRRWPVRVPAAASAPTSTEVAHP